MKRFLTWSIVGCLVALLSSWLVLSERANVFSLATANNNFVADARLQSTQLLDFEIQNGDGQSVITLECFGDDQVGFMDLEGNLVVPQCFTTAYPFNEGLALVGFWESPGQERFGFINQQAEFVFPPAILKDQLVLNDINSYYQYG